MAWTGTRPVSWLYGRTDADYSHQIALRLKYPNRPAPIEELREACLLDGYPPEQVAAMKYPNLDDVNVEKLLRPAFWSKRQTKLQEQHRIERLLQDEAEDSDTEDEQHNEGEDEFDVDDFEDAQDDDFHESDDDT